MSEYSHLTKFYNSIDLIKIVASMQLLPLNHGKIVRLESLARITLANMNENSVKISIDKLQEVLDNEYPDSQYEDRPVNLFTENIMFFNGNFTVFPGNFESATIILNNLLKAIFLFLPQDNVSVLPDIFTKNIYAATTLILNLSNEVAKSCNYKRYLFEDIPDAKLYLPPPSEIEKFKTSVVFSEQWIQEFCKKWHISEDSINYFITYPTDPALLKNYPENSPLCNKPIIKFKDEYIFAQPISGIESLINFIWNEARKNDCLDLLLKSYNELFWNEAQNFCTHLQWRNIHLALPPALKNLHCKEAVYQIDLNKIAYVCFLEGGYYSSLPVKADLNNFSGEVLSYGKLIEERQQTILDFLDKNILISDYNILTQFIISEVGFPEQYSFPNPTEKQPNLIFRISEFKHIVQSEESDPLLLWKFAKAYTEVSNECRLFFLGGMLDVFIVYKNNNNSLWPENEERPENISVIPGYSSVYIRQSVIKRDEHLAEFSIENKVVYTPVYNYCTYAPFYIQLGEIIPTTILLEDFIVPVWFINDQRESKPPQLIISQIEMLAFWLRKIKPNIGQIIPGKISDESLIIKITLDNRFSSELRPDEVPIVDLESIHIPIEVKGNEIAINIPLELVHWYGSSNNQAERYIIFCLLDAIALNKTGLHKNEIILSIIDKAIPLGSAKMSSVLGNANNLQLETRFLPPYRSIQQFDLSEIKINLTRIYGISVDENTFSSTKNKRDLCSRIATILYSKLDTKLKEYDSEFLLPLLIGLNEACVQKKAIRDLDIPARIACFGAQNNVIINLFYEEQNRVKTALNARCLIELITASNLTEGKRIPCVDEVDQLIALMNEIISWASLSDGIHLGLYDPKMQILPCGRIEVDYSTINQELLSFGMAKSEIEVSQHTERYEELFQIPQVNRDDKNISAAITEIDIAFESDWGIKFFRLHDFIIDLVELVRNNHTSVIDIEETVLYNELKKSKFNWSDKEIASALNTLTLKSGWKIGAPPQNYRQSDTFPWRYNRALSFLQKPIATLIKNDKVYYYWGYRHLFASFDNLMALLFSGTLWTNKGGKIERLIEKMGTKKGKDFRDLAVSWFKTQTDLEIIPYEVAIKPGKTLGAVSDLGDIDILAIDHKEFVIYSIECKSTGDSKTPFEIKNEINDYLNKHIQKHLNRDKWLKNNLVLLKVFVSNPHLYSIKSLILTAEDIPLVYLKKDKLPLPFISFPKLKIYGKELLKDI